MFVRSAGIKRNSPELWNLRVGNDTKAWEIGGIIIKIVAVVLGLLAYVGLLFHHNAGVDLLGVLMAFLGIAVFLTLIGRAADADIRGGPIGPLMGFTVLVNWSAFQFHLLNVRELIRPRQVFETTEGAAYFAESIRHADAWCIGIFFLTVAIAAFAYLRYRWVTTLPQRQGCNDARVINKGENV